MLPTAAESFMPHDAPMALIDDIISCDAHHIITRVTVHEQSLFLNTNQQINATVGIEYMAQSAAAWSGYNARQNQGQTAPPIGMLLGTRDYSAQVPYFNLGDVLTIEAQCLMFSAQGMGSFDCVLKRDEQVIAAARLSVYQPQ